MATKRLKLRWPGTCATCATALAAGTEVTWDRDAKSATCGACTTPEVNVVVPPDIDRGVAGASARRKYERDAARERRRKEAAVERDAARRADVVERHPILGRVVNAMTERPVVGPESTAVRNWAKGADGEELVGPILEDCPGVVVLHDRRVPGSKANIDHIVVGPAGIFVVDPKNYEGTLEKRVVGGFFNAEERLYVGGRNQTKLIEKLVWQMQEVRKAIGDEPARIQGVLCFVGPNWRRFFARTIEVRGVPVMWPARVAEHVQQDGDLSSAEVTQLAGRVAAVLKPA